MASGEHEKSLGEESLPLEIDETAMIGEVEAAALHARTRNRLAGDTFGRYRIQKTLGEGAMGSVYLGHRHSAPTQSCPQDSQNQR